jgi:hypothetical protein
MITYVVDGEQRGTFARVRDILFRPQAEWRQIATEEEAALLGGYVAPLAIAGGVISLAAEILYSGFELGPALAWTGVAALLYVVFALASVLGAWPLIAFLVRRFGGEPDNWRCKQLAAYAATPVLVAAAGALIPAISGIVWALGAVYALILLAIGLPRLMSVPDPENNVPRVTLTFAVAAAVLAALAAAFVGPLINSGREALEGAVESAAPAPPAPEIARRSPAEAAIARLAQADAPRVLADPSRLAEQFPDSLPSGFQRQSVATAQRGGISRADAVYARDGARLSVSVIQFASNVDPAAFAALLAIKSDGAEENDYARTQSIDGRLFAEEVSGATSRYVVIGRGVVMIAAGGVTMDQARAAIETIDVRRLEAAYGR